MISPRDKKLMKKGILWYNSSRGCEKMKQFGLVGQVLNYSYSKIIHEYLLAYYQLEGSYELIEIDDLKNLNLNQYEGLNVTIPYKEKIAHYLDNDEKVVNTIYQKRGYNTDVCGFAYLIKQIDKPISDVVILGSGASSKMIQNYFAKDKVKVQVISRQDNSYQLLDHLRADLLINTTPVGMNEYASVIDESLLPNYQVVIDLNYNPLNSKLKMDALKHDIPFIGGLDMLIVQALEAFKIWHGIDYNEAMIKRVKAHVLFSVFADKIAIIGMPLAGKSTFVATYHGVDLDDEVEKKYHSKVSQMLAANTFRTRETQVLAQLAQDPHNHLMALGGGSVLKYENMVAIKDYLIIYLKVPLTTLKGRLATNQRPLLKSTADLERIYQERQALYHRYANLELNNEELIKLYEENSHR